MASGAFPAGKHLPLGAAEEFCHWRFVELLLLWMRLLLNDETNSRVPHDSDAAVPASCRAQLLQYGDTCTHGVLYLNLRSLWCLCLLLGIATPWCLSAEAGVDPAHLARAVALGSCHWSRGVKGCAAPRGAGHVVGTAHGSRCGVAWKIVTCFPQYSFGGSRRAPGSVSPAVTPCCLVAAFSASNSEMMREPEPYSY